MAGFHFHPMDAGQVLQSATVSGAAGSTVGQVVAGVPNQTIRVYRVLLTATVSGAQSVQFVSSGSGSLALSGALVISTSGVGSSYLTLPFDGTAWFIGFPGGNLVVTGTNNGAVQGLVYFTQTNV